MTYWSVLEKAEYLMALYPGSSLYLLQSSKCGYNSGAGGTNYDCLNLCIKT